MVDGKLKYVSKYFAFKLKRMKYEIFKNTAEFYLLTTFWKCYSLNEYLHNLRLPLEICFSIAQDIVLETSINYWKIKILNQIF